MDKNDLNSISLNICNYLLKDKDNIPIYSGDILTRSDKCFDSFCVEKFNDFFLKNSDVDTDLKDLKSLLNSISLDKVFINDYLDDMSVAEYFNLENFNNNKPILYLHGIIQSLQFCPLWKDTTDFYRHLSEDDIENYQFGITMSNLYSPKFSTDYIISKLDSKFSGNIKYLKTFKGKDNTYIVFNYRLKDSVSYKKAKKKQKGIIERLNWYKKYDLVSKFPWLYLYYKNNSIFDLALNDKELYNKFKFRDEMLENFFEILYHFEKNDNIIEKNHSNLSIFCKKYKNSDKKIYFYKGCKNEFK